MSDDASDPIEEFFEKLGLLKEQCPHCNARYFRGDDGPICLNGCWLSGHLFRILIGPPSLPEPFPDPDPSIGEQV